MSKSVSTFPSASTSGYLLHILNSSFNNHRALINLLSTLLILSQTGLLQALIGVTQLEGVVLISWLWYKHSVPRRCGRVPVTRKPWRSWIVDSDSGFSELKQTCAFKKRQSWKLCVPTISPCVCCYGIKCALRKKRWEYDTEVQKPAVPQVSTWGRLQKLTPVLQ